MSLKTKFFKMLRNKVSGTQKRKSVSRDLENSFNFPSKRIVWFVLFLLLVGLVSAVDYPSPKGYVSDYAKVIDANYEMEIEGLLSQLEKETTVEVAVLTVPNLQDLDGSTYAVEIFEEWGIGKKDKDNGLLILVGLEEREWRIEVGYGLEGVITDAMAGRIGRNRLVPNFKVDEYGQGIYEAVVDVVGFVEGEEEVISQYAGKEETEDFNYFYVAFIMALIIGGIVGLVTKKVKDKKIKWGVKIVVGVLVGIALIIFWSYILAIVFFVLYLFMSGGRGGGFMFFPGFGGRGRGGGGFGGFGGGFSGGGGAGGRW